MTPRRRAMIASIAILAVGVLPWVPSNYRSIKYSVKEVSHWSSRVDYSIDKLFHSRNPDDVFLSTSRPYDHSDPADLSIRNLRDGDVIHEQILTLRSPLEWAAIKATGFPPDVILNHLTGAKVEFPMEYNFDWSKIERASR